MLRKRQFYDRYGVDEYWVIDADLGALEVWVRGAAGLVEQRVPDDGFVSPVSGVRVIMADGVLRVCDPGTDRVWQTPFEEAARADAAERRVQEMELRLAALEAGRSPA